MSMYVDQVVAEIRFERHLAMLAQQKKSSQQATQKQKNEVSK